jgi:hypothetical protein
MGCIRGLLSYSRSNNEQIHYGCGLAAELHCLITSRGLPNAYA